MKNVQQNAIAFIFMMMLPSVVRAAIPGDLFFKRIPTGSGFQSAVTTSMIQDSYGFLWFTSSSGLIRYDGINLKEVDDPVNRPFAGYVDCLLEEDGTIWAGSKRGLYKIDVKTLSINPINTSGNNTIRALLRSREDFLWIGTNTGLLKIEPDMKITEYNTFTGKISHNIIRALYEDSNGNLWVGTHDGLNKMTQDGNFEIYNFKGNYKPELPNNLILDIKPLQPGNDTILLIGTETGLVTFDRITGRYTVMNLRNSKLSDEVVKCILTTGDEIWMGTNFGLNVMNRKNGSITNYFHESLSPRSLSSNVVWDIFKDNSGVVWVLTDNGANYLAEFYNDIHFQGINYKYNGKDIGNDIRSLCISNKKIVFGATDNGIFATNLSDAQMLFNSGMLNRRLLMPNTMAIMEDDFGRLWIGTTGGLNIYNPATNTITAHITKNTPAFKTNYIAAIKRFGTEELFVSVWESGIYRINQRFGIDPDVPVQQITSNASDRFIVSGNTMWIVIFDKIYTINIINGQETEMKDINQVLKGRKVKSVYITHSEILYIGTEGGILKYNISNGLNSFIPINIAGQECVINLVEDFNGVLWGSTENAIFRMNGDSSAVTINLGSNFPMRKIHHNCMDISPDGIIFCGGNDGYLYFDPRNISISSFDPPIYITSLSVNNRFQEATSTAEGILLSEDIAFTKEIIFKHSQRNIMLGFASLHYGAPGSNRFRYKMEGLDKEWIYVNWEQNSAIYSKLPAGKYTFIVNGTNNYGQWSNHTASLSIRVYPPVMLSFPFIVLYIILATVFIFGIFRFSTKRLRLLSELRLARLEKEHNRAITDAKIQFFTNISHEFRTLLSLIIPPLKETRDATVRDSKLGQLVDIAYVNSEKLLKLINQLLDFRKMGEESSVMISSVDVIAILRKNFDMFSDGARRMNIRYFFSTDRDSLMMECDAEKMETIVYNLLSNAFKFTPANGMILMEVSVEQDSGDKETPKTILKITISDNGVGIMPQEKESIFKAFYRSKYAGEHTTGSGIGLSIVRNYVDLHGGTVDVKSLPGKGSSFTVNIPVKTGTVTKKPDNRITAENREKMNMEHQGDKPLILYVEDDPGMIEYIKLSLSPKYNVITASNGKEGYEKAVKHTPQLIISDIMMPSEDGLAMSCMLKENPRTRHIPIIILTAKSLVQDQIEGLRAGIDIYMVKPAYPEVLDANIEQILVRRKQMEEYFRNELVIVENIGKGPQDADKKLIDDIINLIEANISDSELSVESISKAIGISPTHLYRRIKKLTGLNTNELIRKYRLKKASLLIKGNKGNTSEIMYYVGFSSSSYFSKCFKNEFGVLPTEYKEKHSR